MTRLPAVTSRDTQTLERVTQPRLRCSVTNRLSFAAAFAPGARDVTLSHNEFTLEPEIHLYTN